MVISCQDVLLEVTICSDKSVRAGGWIGSESRPVRSTTSITSWNGTTVSLLLVGDKLNPTNRGVTPARSLGSILSRLLLQVDDGGVSVPHLTESTFQSSIKLVLVELITGGDFRDVLWP